MMGRNRKDDSEQLPRRLYFKHGAYHYVAPGGKWTRLGPDKDVAVRLAIEANQENRPDYENRDQLRWHIRNKVFPRARNNAKGRSIEFDLTPDDVIDFATASRWRCAVTSIPLSLVPMKNIKRLPYAPSIDRIDSRTGYTLENCRIVCVAVNIALADWGDDVLNKIAIYYARQVFERDFPNKR